ncbi:MAG: protein-export chaperone SecB [Magnetococcales bacterium]|nr:protein-export chaperone SecB [Magnetococcales bacterium]
MTGQPDQAAAGPADDGQPIFHVEKLYLKDFSFESPSAPDIFLEQLEPQIQFNLDSNSTQKSDVHHEVVLHCTVKVAAEERVLFLVELSYAGLFLIRNIPQQHLPPLLAVECPGILFPYARQMVSSVVLEGGFRPFVIDPINFAALYQQKLAQQTPGQVAP